MNAFIVLHRVITGGRASRETEHWPSDCLWCVPDGSWDCCDPDVVLSVSNSAAPVNRMLIVSGKLWCACLNDVIVLSVPALNVEVLYITIFTRAPTH